MKSNFARWSSILIMFMVAISLAACPPPKTPEEQAEELYQKGLQLWDSDDTVEALETWEGAVEKNPDHYDAQFQLGLAYKKIGDLFSKEDDPDNARKAYLLAESHYSEALRINPKDPSAHNNIANVYFAQQKYDEAIGAYNKAIRIKPYDPDYHYNLANTYNKKGMIKQAIEHYEEAIRIDPSYMDAYYNLAHLYEKIGDKNNARRYYQEYINRETRPSEAEWVEKARQKILQLRGSGIY